MLAVFGAVDVGVGDAAPGNHTVGVEEADLEQASEYAAYRHVYVVLGNQSVLICGDELDIRAAAFDVGAYLDRVGGGCRCAGMCLMVALEVEVVDGSAV